MIIAVLVASFLLSAGDDPSAGLRNYSGLPVAVLAILVVVVLRRLLMVVWTALRPELSLARIATVPFPRQPNTRNTPGVVARVRPGSWRTPSHAASFRAAEYLELCVRATVTRLAAEHGEKVTMAARKMAESLRLHSLHAEDDAESRKLFRERLFYSLRLVTGSDPVAVVEPIGKLTLSDPFPPPPLARRRGVRALEVTVGAINVHWTPLKAVLAVIAMIVVLLAGRPADVLGLLK